MLQYVCLTTICMLNAFKCAVVQQQNDDIISKFEIYARKMGKIRTKQPLQR